MSLENYNFLEIEKKWQNKWDETGIFNPVEDKSKKKFYALAEFPYPSGDGLHVGHPRGYTAMDVVSRFKRIKGFNVLFPFGWDAFGLPTENYAIKTKTHPSVATTTNVKRFKEQCKMLGFSFAWDREINTTDPSYFKWTQWIFIQLFNKGLAYKQKMPINWCTSCNVGLANEEVVDNTCERCGGEIIRKERNQWMLKITKYADKLIDGLKDVNFIEKVKTQQINWIGKSKGASVLFQIQNTDEKLEVFTTRPDTLFGATYMVVAPEHSLIEKYKDKISNYDEVKKYRNSASKKSDMERAELALEKTGVELKGIKAINPVNNKEIPIWISDYVLISYGTGAIMAVPAHDSRDYEFAKKFKLPIIEVIQGGNIEEEAYVDVNNGKMVNSDFIDGMAPNEAINKISTWLEDKKLGKEAVNYKLRDWVFSRQRYWGEPIPIVNCPDHGQVTLPESELPLKLPEIDDYRTSKEGDSPISKATEWLKTKCPICKKDAIRETDTMPQWAGSSWYYLRYLDPINDKELVSKEKENYWMPVDWYNGGMEHTTLHLLYSRFWHKVLFELGVVSTSEPYMKRSSHGMVLGNNREKMSKSRGNVINPDDIVNEFGADTFRLYEMFMGAYDQSIPWSSDQISGVHRFLKKVWSLRSKVVENKDFEDNSIIHKTISKVENDITSSKFNTAIAQMMTLVNEMTNWKSGVSKKAYEYLLLLLSPYTPHICEELWESLGYNSSISLASFPEFDKNKMADEFINIPITINGKLRDNLQVPPDFTKEDIRKLVFENVKVNKTLEGKTILKEIYVPKKIYNIVIKK